MLTLRTWPWPLVIVLSRPIVGGIWADPGTGHRCLTVRSQTSLVGDRDDQSKWQVGRKAGGGGVGEPPNSLVAGSGCASGMPRATGPSGRAAG